MIKRVILNRSDLGVSWFFEIYKRNPLGDLNWDFFFFSFLERKDLELAHRSPSVHDINLGSPNKNPIFFRERKSRWSLSLARYKGGRASMHEMEAKLIKAE